MSGDLVVGNDAQGKGGEPFKAPTYACRPPGVHHGPFRSDGGCMLFEMHYYDESRIAMLAPDLRQLPALRPYLAARRAISPPAPTRPRDYLERCLAALDVWEPRIGAFVHLNIDGARAAADAATARWRDGRPLSADRRHAARHQGHHRDDRHADRERLAALRRLALRPRRRRASWRCARPAPSSSARP